MLPAKILAMDDELGIRLFLEETLSRDGHHIVTVDSGEAALARIRQENFDLALLDLNLPGIGGMKVLEVLRQQAPDTVVIILTAHATLETAVEALRQGAHDYLFKPCKTLQLRESIRKGLLKRQHESQKRDVLHQLEQYLTVGLATVQANLKQAPEESVSPALPSPPQSLSAILNPIEDEGRFLQRNGLIVDFSRHVITVDGYLLELSPTEFDLLAYLISEAPRVVSPQELVREVQGYSSEIWEARDIVRQHVYNLRQKIKEAGRQAETIRTVRGVGYTIE